MIDIDRGVPIVERRGLAVYPFEFLEVGDSFAFPESRHRSVENCRTYWQNKLPGRKFKVSRVDLRVWRVK